MESIINKNIITYNINPIDDFEGLSPSQMHSVMYDLFNNDCIVQIKQNIPNEVLDQIGFFRLCEEYLNIIDRDKILKLTPQGRLKIKIVKELYDMKFIIIDLYEKGIFKNFMEEYLNFIHNANQLCRYSGLIKKVNNTISLTAKGKKIIDVSKRQDLFRHILLEFIEGFNWSYNDRHDDELTGQFGIGFTLYLLSKHGQEGKPVGFYSMKYLKAFPKLIENYVDNTYRTKEQQFNQINQIRAFERFLEWFNFIDIAQVDRDSPKQEMSVKINKLFTEVFEFRI